MKTPLKYKWWPERGQRFDAVNQGEPDFFAYVIRYWSHAWQASAWCWILVMPRSSGAETARGWARSPSQAKRQVEAKIEELWR